VEFGLLWYDDSPNRPLADKVQRAAAQYQLKFGQAPTVCFVNPSLLEGAALDGQGGQVGELEIEARRTVLPDHFLVAVTRSRPAERRKGTRGK